MLLLLLTLFGAYEVVELQGLRCEGCVLLWMMYALRAGVRMKDLRLGSNTSRKSHD